MKVGLREANIHFSKYVKMVRQGKKIVLTERGLPVATISPIPRGEADVENRIKLLEEKGILRPGLPGKFPLRKPVTVKGKPISEIVIEEREGRF